MKIVAVILSVYVMALTVLPCADVHAADSNSVSLEFLEQSQGHSSEVDLCSPFCICDCCQTNSQQAIYTTFQVGLIAVKIAIPASIKNEIECTNSFWHLPQV